MPQGNGFNPFVLIKRAGLVIPALRSKKFRLYILGQAIWIPGAWMFISAHKWLANLIIQQPQTVSGSPMLSSAEALGILTFFASLPYLVLSPFATSIADCYDRRKIVMIFQSIRALTHLVMALLIVTNTVSFANIVILATIEGAATAMQFPAKLTLLMDLVGPEKMVSAAGFSSTVMNIGRIVGTIVAGLILNFNPALVFVISFSLSLPFVFILSILRTDQVCVKRSGSILGQYGESAKYVFKQEKPMLVLAIISTAAILGYGVQMLMPYIAKDILHLDSIGYGFVEASVGAGAFIGAILLSFKAGFGKPVKIFSLTAVALPIVGLLITLAIITGWLPIIMLCFAMFGFTITHQNSLGRSILPVLVHRHFAGRMMGFFSLSMMGLKPIGNLLVGFLVSIFTLPTAFIALYGTLLASGIYPATKLFMSAKEKDLDF